MSLHPGGQTNTVTEPGCRAHIDTDWDSFILLFTGEL